MRACSNCGDWVGDAITACPKCGAEVAAAGPRAPAAPPGTWGAAPGRGPRPDWAPPADGGGVPGQAAPPSPTQQGAPPYAPPPSYGAPPAYGAPPYGQTVYGPSGYGPYAPPKKRRTALIVVLSVVGVFGFLFAGAVVLAIVFEGSAKELDAYMDGGGVTYSFPADKAKVRLATEPKYETQEQAVAGALIQADTAIIEKRAYEMLYMRIDLPELPPANVRGALVGGINGLAAGADIEIGAMQDVKVDGNPAVWAHGTWKDDEADVTAIYANRKIYVLAVHTRDDSTDVQREFEDSFDAG